MASLDNIVQVDLNLQEVDITQLGFSRALLFGPTVKFTDRVRIYDNADELQQEFGSDSIIYKVGNRFFQQEPRPAQVLVGRRQVDSTTVTVDTFEDGYEYKTTINGTVFSYTAQSADDKTAVAGALVTAINSGSEPVTATDNADGTYDIDADSSGTAYSLVVDDKQSISQLVASDTASSDLEAIYQAEANWYHLLLAEEPSGNATNLDTLAANVADWVESRMRVFHYNTDDSAVLDPSSTNDIMYDLKELDYVRTESLYHPEFSSHIAAAYVGAVSTFDPGSVTWANQHDLAGVKPVKMNSTEAGAVQDKNGNTYRPYGLEGNLPMVRMGTLAGGRSIELTVNIDWLKIQLQDRIARLLAEQNIVYYTNEGITQVVNFVRSVLSDAVTQGVLIKYNVPVPRLSSISQQNIQDGLLPLDFTATVTTAIKSVSISGTLTIGL